MDDLIEKTKVEALEQAIKYLEELMPSDMICILDKNFRYEFINEKPYMKILGYTKKDLIGNTPRKIIHPLDLEKLAISLRGGDDIGENLQGFRAKHRNGNWKWLEIRGKIFHDEDGDTKILIISRDITDQMLSDQLLRKSEKKYRRLHEKSPNARVVANIKGIILDCNSATEKLFGFTKKELIGRNYANLGVFTSEQLSFLGETYQDFLNGKEVESIEIQILRKDGSIGWVSHQSSLIELGSELLIEIIFQDITERKKAEQKLKDSEEKHRLIIENLSDIVIESDLMGKFNYFSPQIHEIFGYKTIELSKIRLYNFIHPEDFDNFADHLKSSIITGKIISVEYRGRHKDGHYILVSFKGRAFKDNERIKLIGVIRDITERKKAERKIKESEEKYRGILENMREGYFEVDLEGNLEYFNDRVCEFLGYSREELMGRNFSKFIKKDNIEKITKSFNKIYRDDTPHLMFEPEVINNDGTIRILDISAYLRRNPDGNKSGFYCFTRDITKRKETERKLKETEQKYRGIIEQNYDGYYEVDLSGNFTFVNKRVCDFLGYSENELIGKNFRDYTFIKDIKKLFANFNSLYEKEYPQITLEYEALTKDGQRKPIECAAYLKRDINGKKVGFYGLTRDIEIRKQLMESEDKYRNAYNQAEFYKDVFTHDINNILNAIQLSSDLTSFYLNEPDKLEELTEIIVKHVGRGADLVKNIQKLSLLDEIEMILEPIEVKKVLNNSIIFLKDSIQDEELNIKLDAPLEELFVRANEFLLDVFENILVNAVKHSDNHKINIDIKLSNYEENGVDYLKIEFIDNARGILDDEKQAILKKGFKKDRRSQGLGIGLSLVKKIIEGYKGRIWVENRVPEDYSKGSNFILLIPKAN